MPSNQPSDAQTRGTGDSSTGTSSLTHPAPASSPHPLLSAFSPFLSPNSSQERAKTNMNREKRTTMLSLTS